MTKKLANNVRTSYSNILVPAGTPITIIATPPRVLSVSGRGTFIYATVSINGKDEALHIERTDVVGGRGIKIIQYSW